MSKGFCVWFTGIPASGKTTHAEALKSKLEEKGFQPVLLDGDDVRKWLTPDLGFSENDRFANVMRVANVAKRIVDSGSPCIVSLVSPNIDARVEAKELIGRDRFTLVHIDLPVEKAIERDPKGLYKKAINKEIDNFTGISADYELPIDEDPLTVVGDHDLDSNVEYIINSLDYLPTYHEDQPSLFIGRWQPFHDGHERLIRQVLVDRPVVIGIRDTKVDDKNPYSTDERVRMIIGRFLKEIIDGKVQWCVIPDFAEICVGRDVGYGIRTIHLDEKTESISGTAIRYNLHTRF